MIDRIRCLLGVPRLAPRDIGAEMGLHGTGLIVDACPSCSRTRGAHRGR